MRKRNKEENPWIDNAEYCQDGKRRRKTRSSEKFARELQSFEHTLDNVKRLYADSKDRLARDSLVKKLCYTESFNEVSTPPISTGILSPQQLTLPNFDKVSTPPISTSMLLPQQHTLPNLDEASGSSISSRLLSPQQHPSLNFDEVSTPPISTGIVSPQQHTSPNFDKVSTPPSSTGIISPQQHTLPNFDKVSTPPISTSILLPQQHSLPNFDEASRSSISTRLLSPQQHPSLNFDKVSTPPISIGIVSPQQHTSLNLDKVSTPPSSTGIISPQQHTLPNFDKVSTPPILTGISSPRQPTLPNFNRVSMPPIFTGISSPRQQALPNFDKVSTPPILTGISSPWQHTLPNFDKVPMPPILAGMLSPTLPNFDKVSTLPFSTGILFPQQHSLPHFNRVSTVPILTGILSPQRPTLQDFAEVFTPPILISIVSPHQPTLPLSMQQTPAGVDSPTSTHRLTPEDKSEPRDSIVDMEGIQGVSACVEGNHEAPSVSIEPPSEPCGNPEEMNGRESSIQSMQQKHSCKLPCHEAAVVVVSNVFSSFLKRLVNHGVYIDLRNSPGFEKNVPGLHQVEDSKHNGTEELKEVELKKQSETSSLVFSKRQEDSKDLTEVELGKHIKSSSELLSKSQEDAKETEDVELEKQLPTSSLLFSTNEEVVKEWKELDGEKNGSILLTTHEDNVNRLKETEPEKQNEMSSFFFSTTEDTVSDSDNEDDGDLKHLWDDMEFSLACMNESKRDQAGLGNKKSDGCNHDFYKKDDLGLVCSLCGLVGQDTEHIFNYIWGEASKKKRNGKHAVKENPDLTPLEEELSDRVRLLPVQQTNQPLVLHSEYKDRIRTHQEDGIRFLERNLVQDDPHGCILAHAPGTGKSFLIIAFLQSFQNSFPDERPVIVAPNGMLSVWVREFKKWKVEDIPIFNLYEAPSSQEQDDNDNRVLRQRRQGQFEMLQQWRAQKSILLVGYPTFSRLISGSDAQFFPGIKKLLLEVPGLLILDEGHFPRNKDTQILKSLSQVQTRRRVLLSGTLFQNNFYELYNLYYLVRPDFMTLNASCTKSLLENFMKASSSPAKMKFSPSPKGSKQRSRREDMELRLFENLGETIKLGEPEEKRQAISQLRQLSEPFVHWYKGQVLEELPGLVDFTLILKMTPLQQELLSSLQAKVENQLDRTVKSTKVCIHPILVNVAADAAHSNEPSWKDSEVDPKSSSKIMFVLDLLQLATPLQEKVLLFSQLLDPFYLLEKMLKKLWGWRLNKEILKIEGQTSLEERESVIDRFNQDPKSKILFASIKTCGEGVSLIGASRIVLLDVMWNPMVSRQAISRAFRIGQKRKVFVYRLVGQGSMEEYAHTKASEKEWLAKQIFEGCRDEDYASYCHEVNPLEEDTYFESQYLRENIHKCLRYHFV